MKKYLPYIFPLVFIVGVFLCLNFVPVPSQNGQTVPDAQISNVVSQNPTTPSEPTKPDQSANSSVSATNPKGTAYAIPILMYHEIGNGPNSLYVPEDKFRTQMDYLYKSGYHTVTVSQALELLASGKIPAKTIVLTFDDGYVSCYTKAWPIMKEFGFTGTFYVVSSFSDRYNYLTWEQLRTMQEAGLEIGSHSQHHPSLKTSSASIQSEEILGSKKILEEKLGVPIKAFCYPIGAYNDNTLKLVKEAGYTSAVTVAYGYANSKNNFFLIPRVRVPGWITLDNFAKNIQL